MNCRRFCHQSLAQRHRGIVDWNEIELGISRLKLPVRRVDAVREGRLLPRSGIGPRSGEVVGDATDLLIVSEALVARVQHNFETILFLLGPNIFLGPIF